MGRPVSVPVTQTVGLTNADISLSAAKPEILSNTDACIDGTKCIVKVNAPMVSQRPTPAVGNTLLAANGPGIGPYALIRPSRA